MFFKKVNNNTESYYFFRYNSQKFVSKTNFYVEIPEIIETINFHWKILYAYFRLKR